MHASVEHCRIHCCQTDPFALDYTGDAKLMQTEDVSTGDCTVVDDSSLICTNGTWGDFAFKTAFMHEMLSSLAKEARILVKEKIGASRVLELIVA